MNHIMKAVILSLGVVSTIGLTACQSSSANTSPSVTTTADKHASHTKDFEHKRNHFKNLSAEEKAAKRTEMQERIKERKQHRDQLNRSCEGKVGETINVKIGDKSIEGTCKVSFQPNHERVKK